MFFEEAKSAFGWPSPTESSPSPPADAACRKLAQRLQGKGLVQAQILNRNPVPSGGQRVPLAIVCEFARHPGIETLREAHTLAWNLCEGEQIIFLVADERLIQGWSCLVPPSQWNHAQLGDAVRLDDSNKTASTQDELLRAFQWVNLAGDYFQKRYEEKFRPENRADRLLVENLRAVRRSLLSLELTQETCHNLLARLIFVQYLFQRADSQGRPFLDKALLAKLAGLGTLSSEYDSLAELLRHKSDTYSLFRWLNTRFNGDLFPREGSATLSREEKEVKAHHLRLLADYLDGKNELSTGQGLLWSHYFFEAIPISFISSLYEEFLTEDERGEDKAYYTPPFFVDFILDTALPWESEEWDVRVLDPCCGSGIFLVKAFQRLVHRWRRAHPGDTLTVPILKRLLQKNLVGVDIHKEAIRVASFSLYLAMADEIDPRQYWQTTVFPPVRGANLIDGDFFDKTLEADHPALGAGGFDLVLGNPPWGKNSAKEHAKDWSRRNGWKAPNGDVGPLFVAKGLTKLKPGGDLAMVQPTSFLMNQTGPIQRLRERIFREVKTIEVNNFSALRFGFFSKVVGPFCVIYLANTKPDHRDTITYLSPKQSSSDYICVEPSDWHYVHWNEAISLPWIWTALVWGERRSVDLMRKLLTTYPNLEIMKASGKVYTREGVIRGDRSHRTPLPEGRKILPSKLNLDPFSPICADLLTANRDLEHHSGDSSDYAAFAFPQLIIKQSWVAKPKRFVALRILPGRQTEGVLCTDSFVSVHGNSDLLDRIWLVFNSRFAVWWQMLRSAQFATFIPKPVESDLRQVPIPDQASLNAEECATFAAIDDEVCSAFGLSEAERVLVDDLFTYTLADFKDGDKSLGRTATERTQSGDPLSEYATWVLRVLKSGFGKRPVAATVFREASGQPILPLRIVAVHLHTRASAGNVSISELPPGQIFDLLHDLFAKVLREDQRAGFCAERHLRLYDSFTPTGEDRPVPTVFIAKPDRQGLWTRTQAMRDADEISADILSTRLVP